MDWIFKIIIILMGLLGLYIAVRVLSKATFKSYFETKDEYHKKEGGVNGGKKEEQKKS